MCNTDTIQKDSEASRARAARIVFDGGVIAFRSDTFYGLGADPANAQAVRRIVELKGREEKPILLLISDADLVPKYLAETSARFDAIAKRFWPGPVTLIGIAREELADGLTAGTGTIGLRLPDDADVRALVRACGGALTATSANPAGKAPARTTGEVADYFPSGIDLIIDGGEVTATQASTVLDLTHAQPQIVREGAISRSELEGLSTDCADYTD